MNLITELKDGEYTAEIEQITCDTTTKGVPRIEWILRIIGDEYDGQRVSKKFHLVNQDVVALLKKELKMIGHEVADSCEFEAKKEKIIGTKIMITAVTRDDGWLSLYVKGPADKTGGTKSNFKW